MKPITISPKVLILIIVLYSFLPFAIGMITGAVMVDSDGRGIAVARVHNEMRDAIREGKAFFLKGSNIKIIPVSEKRVKAKVISETE